MSSAPASEVLRVEPELRLLLSRIDATCATGVGGTGVGGLGTGGSRAGVEDGRSEPLANEGREDRAEPITEQRAGAMLARIAWSRLAEPGDSVAGALLRAVGAEAALDMLVSGTNAKTLGAALSGGGFEIGAKTISDALARWLPRLNRAETVRDVERAAACAMNAVLPDDPAWPRGLDDLGGHRPTLLWVRGKLSSLSAHSIGVVGARAATGYGSHVTAEIVSGACTAGLTIVSGAAYGIDAVAHRAALAASASTVAVVAGGADRPYPQAHDSLLARIADTGAICSEMVPGAAPTKWRFLMRNRLIAALSDATLVTEAGIKSGSLNTAGHPARV